MKTSNKYLNKVSQTHLLLAPAVLWYAIFLVLPLFVLVAYSFLTYENFGVLYEFSLGAWQNQVFNPTTMGVLGTTLAVAFLTTLITLILGFPVAYYMRFHMSQLGGTFLLLFMVIVFWTAQVIRMIGWYPILGQGGVINIVAHSLGLIETQISWLLFSEFSKLLGYVQNYVLFMAAPIYVALFRVEEDLLDASETLRGEPFETFRYVVWPQSLPGVVIGFIFVFVMSIGDFVIPVFLGPGGNSMTGLIYGEVSSNLNYPSASAMSVLLLIIIFGVIFTATRRVDITDLYEV